MFPVSYYSYTKSTQRSDFLTTISVIIGHLTSSLQPENSLQFCVHQVHSRVLSSSNYMNYNTCATNSADIYFSITATSTFFIPYHFFRSQHHQVIWWSRTTDQSLSPNWPISMLIESSWPIGMCLPRGLFGYILSCRIFMSQKPQQTHYQCRFLDHKLVLGPLKPKTRVYVGAKCPIYN